MNEVKKYLFDESEFNRSILVQDNFIRETYKSRQNYLTLDDNDNGEFFRCDCSFISLFD